MTSNFRTTLHAAGSTATGNGTIVSIGDDWGACDYMFSIVGSAGVATGVVTVEAAHASDYAGTWAVLSAVTVVASTVITVAARANYRHVRARISTTIGGGSVTVFVDIARAV